MVVGIDEVGRGAWAGPLLVVAASTNKILPINLQDSKKLTKIKREELFSQIILTCKFGEGWVKASEIDKIGISNAMKLGVKRALLNLKVPKDANIIMDGLVNYCPNNYIKVKCESKADQKYPIVSAASVYAKVSRDNFMCELDAQYPNYGFAKHVGYGTKLHSNSLNIYGISPYHRLSFKPIARVVNDFF